MNKFQLTELTKYQYSDMGVSSSSINAIGASANSSEHS